MRLLLMIFVIFYTEMAFASEPDSSAGYTIGVINPPQNFNFGVWNISDNLQIENGYCVEGFFRLLLLFPFRTQVDHYFTGSNGYSNANSFRMFNIESGDYLNFTIEALNVDNGSYGEIIPVVENSYGEGLFDCSDEGAGPFSLRVSIQASDLINVSAGTYQENITLRSQNGGRNDPSVIDNFNISVEVPNIVQVSQLDDIDLGVFNISNNLFGEDQFCIYRNKNYAYRVKFNDNSSGSNFNLIGIESGEVLPYSVSFRGENEVYQNVNKNIFINKSMNNSNVDCVGTEKVFMRIDVEREEMIKVLSDDYTSTLNVIVSPE